jgi:CheY-like chemotaxis protein/nitrogen-specific signal transduction histidine kinase
MHEIARLQQRARALESEVTHRRALEVDLRQALAREQLALRAKDEFVAMLGHELRNPLGVIALSIQLMSQRLGDEALEERRAIERQAKMLGRLVDDLLEGARVSQGKIELRKEQLELSRIVARALEIASPLIARKHQALHVSVPSEGLGIEGDCERLTQAVANLLTNAAKYTGEGGTIRVTGGAADGRVILRVADDGVGIAPELLLRIFEPFVQGDQSLDRSEGGLGLGLAVAKRLVELHGGTIVARSDGPGRGSELTVSLTQIACPPYDRSATGWAPEAPEQRLKVMVVDDNVDLAAAVGAAVQQLGHEVSVIHRAGAALAALSTRPPDVALVDIGLPEMDGYELARRVRARATGPRVFLVAVTGYGDASYRARSLDAGFDAHVVKPLDLPALQALLGGVPCAPRA